MRETIHGLVDDEGVHVPIFLTTRYLEEADRLADRIADAVRRPPWLPAAWCTVV